MYPILLQIPPFSFFGFEFGPLFIFSHGVLTAVGLIAGLVWFVRKAQKYHLHLEFIADHFFSLLIWSVIGARLGYILVFFSRFQEYPLSTLYLWDGGYLLWSGIIFFLGVFWYHCHRAKERFGPWLDVMVPAGTIALVFDAIGAFLGGEQYGIPTERPWGLVFENPEVPFTIAIHPVQLYLLALLILLLILFKILHRRQLRPSMTGLIGLLLLGLFFFLTEYFRGDEMLISFNHRFTQILELLVILFSGILIWFTMRKGTPSSE